MGFLITSRSQCFFLEECEEIAAALDKTLAKPRQEYERSRHKESLLPPVGTPARWGLAPRAARQPHPA